MREKNILLLSFLVFSATTVSEASTETNKYENCNATCANNSTIVILKKPICQTSCINGKIEEPGICKCNSGYKLSRNYQFICNPIASWNVKNKQYNCYKPGYVMDGNKCVPECKNCTSGICLKPNTCMCLDANVNLYNGSFCKRKCPEFSYCEGPSGNCQCMEGYKKSGHSCKPECSSGCYHGTCVKKNVCKCHHGWEGKSCSHKILYSCYPSCIHGKCEKGNVCKCNYGWKGKSCSERKHYHCYPKCKHGKCEKGNVCNCKFGWIGKSCSIKLKKFFHKKVIRKRH